MVAINFKQEYAPAILAGIKTQTIRKPRKDGRAHCKPGDALQLYTGMRTKNCVNILNVVCISYEPVTLYLHSSGFFKEKLSIAGAEPLSLPELEKFAHRDGFNWANEMFEFFAEQYGLPFEGYLIKWAREEEIV